MLLPDFIDALPDNVMQYIDEAIENIIADMARRIVKMDYATDTSKWQLAKLRELGAVQDAIMRELSKATGLAQEELVKTFKKASVKTLATDDKIYRQAGYNPTPLAENSTMQAAIWAGLQKTNGTFFNLTRTTANTATLQFERVLDEAYMKITSGAFSYQEAIKQGVKELASKGIEQIRYQRPGKPDYVSYADVAFRRATLTGINQTALKLQELRMEEMGSDLVETTAHAGARPEHAVWQGKIFSYFGKSKEYPNFREATGYGTGAGLGGWNCRHGFYPYYEGVSETANNKKQIEEVNNKVVYFDGKSIPYYKATQTQRENERSIRKIKNAIAGLKSAGLDYSEEKTELNTAQAKQREFIKQTGLRRDYFRERGGEQLTT